jgi:hypothetical protein
MKKCVFLILLLFMPVQQARGQALLVLLFGDKLSTEKFQIGINALGSASNFSGVSGEKMRYSWGFGALGEVNLGDPLYLQFDLTVKTPGGASKIPWLVPGDPRLDSLFNDVSADLNLSYITLPVWIKYRAGAFKFGLGGQIGYMTGATEVYTGKTIVGDDFALEKDRKGELNRWDYAVTGIIDWYFKPERKMKSMRLSLKYSLGLGDIIKDNTGDKVTNSVFLLSLGIPVGGSKDAGEGEG